MILTGPESVQGSPEWLAFRKLNKIGASEIPIILGVSKWATPLLLWKRKLGFAPPQADNPAMKRGRDLENYVRQFANETYEKNFEPAVVVHPELEWAIASLDGIDQEQGILLEIKCPNIKDHQDALKGVVPEQYKAQVQWQLFCSDLTEAWYLSYHDDTKYRVIVKRDDEYLASILPTVSEFYRCLVEMQEPAYTEKDSIHIEDDLFRQYAEQWKYANEIKTLYSDKEKQIRAKLTDFSDDGNIHGFGISIKRVRREGATEWKKLWEDLSKAHPDICKEFDVNSYRKEKIGYWKISKDK